MAAPPALMGLTDVGEAIGISPQAVWNRAARDPTFPAPRTVRRTRRLWAEDDLRAWAAEHGYTWNDINDEGPP